MNAIVIKKMTLTLDTELEHELEKYPEVLEVLPVLIREQIKLEKWRQRKFEPESRVRAKRLIQEASELDLTREQAVELLGDSIEKIGKHIDD